MSDTNTIILCPGQGAQAVEMGRAWAEKSAEAKAVFDQANDVLGFDLAKLCFEGPADDLNRTDNAQCAIYTASVACFRALEASGGLGPIAATAGLSLGEFTALHLAGAFSFAEGLKLVRLRGEAMQDAAEASEGSMVALTGKLTEDQVNELCEKARGDGVLVPANFNTPMQIVVSGSKDACERVLAEADAMGLRATPLAVAGAFHSELMRPAADRLAAALDGVAWAEPTTTVYSNVTAQPHAPQPDSIKQRLVDQLTSPVRWSQSMQAAIAEHTGAAFVELCPNRHLAGMMRKIDRSVKVENFSEPK